MSKHTSSTLGRRIAFAVAAGLLVVSAAEAQAQEQRFGAFEVRPYVGAYIPTGDQRDLLEDAVLVGAQGSWRVNQMFAVTGTFGWAPSKDRIQAGDEWLDLYQYDVGAEVRAPAWYQASSWNFTPFAALGIGGRTYDYRDLDDVDSKTNVAGYGALGGEFGFGRLGLRVEARDYVSRFESLTDEDADAKTRNDVTLAAGLTVRF